jgi:hypothetical protein
MWGEDGRVRCGCGPGQNGCSGADAGCRADAMQRLHRWIQPISRGYLDAVPACSEDSASSHRAICSQPNRPNLHFLSLEKELYRQPIRPYMQLIFIGSDLNKYFHSCRKKIWHGQLTRIILQCLTYFSCSYDLKECSSIRN